MKLVWKLSKNQRMPPSLGLLNLIGRRVGRKPIVVPRVRRSTSATGMNAAKPELPMKSLHHLLQRFADADLEFVVAGGFAGVLHGSSYVTEDLDICAVMSA